MNTYAVWQVEIICPADAMQASEVQERYCLSFWDATIIVAATKEHAAVLVTGDLNAGQNIEGVQINNRFL